jgi:hypothetical protein
VGGLELLLRLLFEPLLLAESGHSACIRVEGPKGLVGSQGSPSEGMEGSLMGPLQVLASERTESNCERS